MNKTGNRGGFAALELVLLVVIVLGIGGVGWYAVSSKHKTQTQLDNAAKESAAAATAASSSNISQKFVFKEIGVQVILPSSLKGLSYTTMTSDGLTYLNVTTPGFTTALNKCDPSTVGSAAAFASIAKIAGQYSKDNYPIVGNLIQFKDFWVSDAQPNGIVCADSTSQQVKDQFQSIFSSSDAALVEAFKTATLVQ